MLYSGMSVDLLLCVNFKSITIKHNTRNFWPTASVCSKHTACWHAWLCEPTNTIRVAIMKAFGCETRMSVSFLRCQLVCVQFPVIPHCFLPSISCATPCADWAFLHGVQFCLTLIWNLALFELFIKDQHFGDLPCLACMVICIRRARKRTCHEET